MLVPPGSQLVFDQVLWKDANLDFSPGTLSDPKFNDWLGEGDNIRLFAVVNRVTGAVNDPGALLVQMQETGDEESAWFLTYGSEGFVIAAQLATSGETLLAGSDTETARGRPSLGFRRLIVKLFGSTLDTVSARVRIWAATRAGCRKFNRLLFKERIQGTSSIYTPDSMAECFAEVDRLAIGVLTEEVSGTLPTLTVQAEESANGKTWKEMQVNPEISGIAIGNISDSAKFHVFGIANALPGSSRVRFRLQLGGTSPAATTQVWVTGRDVFPD